MKNSNDFIGNQTRDLPTCSALPQPTAPPRAPLLLLLLLLFRLERKLLKHCAAQSPVSYFLISNFNRLLMEIQKKRKVWFFAQQVSLRLPYKDRLVNVAWEKYSDTSANE